MIDSILCRRRKFCLAGDGKFRTRLPGIARRQAGHYHAGDAGVWPHWHAPHGTYCCLGTDAWVSIAVRSQAEWAYLCTLVDQPWTADEQFATAEGRRQHAAALDEYLEAWTQECDADQVTERLQAHGIPAAPVLMPWTVFDNPQLQDCGFFEKICHPEAGTHLYAGIPWKMSRTPGRVRMPPPCLGEHNEEILEVLVGLSPQEIERLTEAGITGRTPPRT